MAKQFGKPIEPSARRAVAWYAPSVLLQAGRELLSSTDFQRNLDRRESFLGPVDVIDLSQRAARDDEPFWFDFISDTGDSGNATYAVARAALEPQLTTTNKTEPLPSGSLLILGGDLAYPGASPEEYQYRFLEPFEMAKQNSNADTREKIVAAIPQNHDWFDSLSTFCRYFVNRDVGDFIGARTPQKRTYFALKLPHNWWILGFDFALGGDIDRNQYEAFRALLGTPAATADKNATPAQNDPPQIGADAQLILIYPEPYWYRELGDDASSGYPKRYQRLEHLLENSGARIALRLAGDHHHYARDTLRRDTISKRASHLVVCGCGGAFLHPTHCRDSAGVKILDRAADLNAISDELQQRIRVGLASAADLKKLKTQTATEKREATIFADEHVYYPSKCKSRLRALTAVVSLFKLNRSDPKPSWYSRNFFEQLWNSNIGFCICLGLLYGFNAYVNVFSQSFIADKLPMAHFGFYAGMMRWLHAMVFSPTAFIINLIMLAGCLRIAWEGPVSWYEKLISGLLHGLLHSFCVYALYWLGSHFIAGFALNPPFFADVAVWLFVTICGMFVGGLLFGTYFAIANAGFGQMPNNAFGALAIQHYKGFLRFEMREKKLHAYFIGLDHVGPRAKWTTPLSQDWEIKDQFDV